MRVKTMAPKNKGKKSAEPTPEPASKQIKQANWAKSSMTELQLTELVNSGLLPPKEEIGWRAPEEETRPQPEQNEVIIFADHLNRGFRPPGSRFFRNVLQYYNLRPQDLAPNSILNLSNFQVFCEDYLQMEPTVNLFQEFFYCNKQTECSGGPALECGGVTIQKRRDCIFPNMKLASHPKGWQKTFFYCKDTSPEGQNPLPGYRFSRLEYSNLLTSYAPAAERKALEPIYQRINALIAHGLKATDLTRCWVGWHIQPLSVRTRLFHQYTSQPDDDMCYSRKDLTPGNLVKAVKKLLGEPHEKISIVGLAPFEANNPPPAVRIFDLSRRLHVSLLLYLLIMMPAYVLSARNRLVENRLSSSYYSR